jgi:hypothetical protein
MKDASEKHNLVILLILCEKILIQYPSKILFYYLQHSELDKGSLFFCVHCLVLCRTFVIKHATGFLLSVISATPSWIEMHNPKKGYRSMILIEY